MPFAQAEGFWKPPNIIDVASILLAVGSIWLAWWLAKRDIQKRLDEATDRASRAARDEVRRVARAVVHTGTGDAVRSIMLAREACRGKKWMRAWELCEVAREQLARVLAQPAADDDVRAELRDVSTSLGQCVKLLRGQARGGETPGDVADGLDESILALYRVEGRMTGIRPEVSRE